MHDVSGLDVTTVIRCLVVFTLLDIYFNVSGYKLHPTGDHWKVRRGHTKRENLYI
jgi:hypothetical protein